MTACLDCGRPGNKGSRCPTCKQRREREHSAPYKDPEYKRLGDEAIANAGSHCPRCLRPYTRDNPPTRGHLVAVREGGTASEGIEAQCRKCNSGWRRTGL